MRSFSVSCASWIICAALPSILLISTAARADVSAKPADQAAQLVQRALQAEADGKPDDRADLLKQALATAPDFAPGHWQLGEIRSGDQWTSVDDAVKQDAHSGKLDEYRKLRDQAAQTVDDQLKLARWCEKAGLKEQQRAHLMFVLQLEPNNKEAISKLGLVRFRGQLVPATQVDEIKDKLKQSTTVSKEWKDRVNKWHEQLSTLPKSSREDVLKQIRAVSDPAAIPAMERGLSHSGQDVGLAVVTALSGMSQQSATDALVRAALLSPYDQVRRDARYALRSRSMYGYAPLLIAELQAPIKVEYDVLNFDAQNFTHRLRLTREYADHEDVRSDFASSTFEPPIVTGRDAIRLPVPNMTAMQTAAIAARQQQTVCRILATVQQTNDQALESNTALTGLLADVTGQELGSDPTAWWDWWYDYNGYYRPEELPVNYSGSSTNNYSRPVIRSECFVAGTTVWTISGPMAIESVKVGELVLARNPESGELAYKPVIDLTTRPTSQLIETHLGDTVIRSTTGHPFWVSGKGWQMAKELKAGQWLHTANGAVQVDSAEPSDEAVCYNLVVADFHDYFVSSAKVLVHDNLLRGPTLSTVPGMAETK